MNYRDLGFLEALLAFFRDRGDQYTAHELSSLIHRARQEHEGKIAPSAICK